MGDLSHRGRAQPSDSRVVAAGLLAPPRRPAPAYRERQHIIRTVAGGVSARIITLTMHPWHDSYIDDSVLATAFPGRHRDPEGQQEQVRARQGDRAAPARSGAVQRGALSGRLRVHSADFLRRRRSARRAGARPGAGVSADHRRGARHRRDADARREGHRRQDRRGQRPRSVVRRLHRQGAAARPRAASRCGGSSRTTRCSNRSR